MRTGGSCGYRLTLCAHLRGAAGTPARRSPPYPIGIAPQWDGGYVGRGSARTNATYRGRMTRCDEIGFAAAPATRGRRRAIRQGKSWISYDFLRVSQDMHGVLSEALAGELQQFGCDREIGECRVHVSMPEVRT